MQRCVLPDYLYNRTLASRRNGHFHVPDMRSARTLLSGLHNLLTASALHGLRVLVASIPFEQSQIRVTLGWS